MLFLKHNSAELKGRSDADGVDGAGCAVLSLDNYNDASRLIDGNFDGEGHPGN